MCFSRLGPPAPSRCWTQLVVRHAHAAPRRGLNAAPLPPAHPTACVGVLRRKPPRLVSSVLRPVERFELDARPQPGWLPALALRQRRNSRPLRVLRSRFRSRDWGRAGAWAAPRPARLPRPCGDRAGAQCTSGSALAPARSDRRPSAAAPNTRCGATTQRRPRCTAMTCSKHRSLRSQKSQASPSRPPGHRACAGGYLSLSLVAFSAG